MSMDIVSLMDRIHKENIFIELENDQLKLTIQEGTPTKELLESIKTSKPEIMRYLNAARGYKTIPKCTENSYYATSSEQRRIFALQELEKDSIVYNLPVCYFLQGNLDQEKLEKSFQIILDRHEILRSYITFEKDTIVQRVLEQINFGLTCRTIEEHEVEEIVKNFPRPFNLSKAPLFTVELFKIKENKHLLCMDFHHIIFDGVSLAILIQDLKNAYQGGALEALPIQYKDFAVWEQEEISGQVLNSQKEFWVNQFKDQVPVLNLPNDLNRPPAKSFEGALYKFEISKETTSKLHVLCRKHNVTLYMLLLAIFKIVLAKYSRQEEIVVGTVTSGRFHEELKKLIGMFAKTLVIKTSPIGKKCFTEYLLEVKSICLSAFDNQHFPFEELINELNLERDISRNPLFDVMFVFQNMEAERLEIEDLKVEFCPSEVTSSKFDITLTALEREEKLNFFLEYSKSLFLESTIQRLSEHFVETIKNILLNPETKIEDISICSNDEKYYLVKTLNEIEVSFPKQATIHDIFQEKVVQYPENIAVSLEGTGINYKELDEKSNNLAGLLIDSGIKPNDIVAVYLDRSTELVIAILGILKAGGIYLPLDIDYPDERITYMITDSKPKAVISQAKYSKNLILDKIIDIDEVSTVFPHQVTLPSINSENIAYIIYTSGTTGKPKGSLIKHSNLVSLLFNDKFPFQFNNKDVWTMFHSQCFDFSIWEIFGALLFGGKLIIIPKMVSRDPGRFYKTIVEENVTVLSQTPSAFSNLFQTALTDYSHSSVLRYVIFGGEQIKLTGLDKWIKKYPNTKLINMYGITETTIHVTYKEILLEDIKIGKNNIGKCLPHLKCYILDENMVPCPVGVPGEIYVGGVGVSKGYLNRPDLTLKKFKQNPFEADDLIYRSGDLARWSLNGEMEYLGRIDNQIKIRGFRIEIGEIENQLGCYEGISEIVVVVKEDADDKYLCAYIVSDNKIHPSDIRQFLLAKLPEYMVPQYFIQIDSIPLTVNGKLEKKLLPDPLINLETGKGFVKPKNFIEEKLLEIWSDSLGINKEKISINTNFFELGGNSLKLIGVISKINKALNIELSLKDFYKYQNIIGIGEAIKLNKGEDDIKFPNIVSDKKNVFDPFPLSNTQFSYWIGRESQMELGNVSTHAFWNFEAKLDIQNFNNTLNKLIVRHEALRTVILPNGQQQIIGPKEYTIEVKDIQGLNNSEQSKVVEEYVKKMSHFIFDPTNWPLFEVKALKKQDGVCHLFIGLDPIIADAYSCGLLYKEFEKLYYNSDFKLPEISINYRDYILAFNQLKQSKFYQSDKSYWLSKLKDFPQPPNLPLEKDLKDVKKPHFKSYRKIFSIHESNLIKSFAKRKKVTLSTFLLTVFSDILSIWSNQKELALNLTVFNRYPFHQDIDKIVGDFTSLLILDIKLKPQQGFDEKLATVQNSMLEALDHRLYDGVELIREIATRQNLVKKAIMPVVFTSALFDTSEDFQSDDESLIFERDKFCSNIGSQTSQVYLDNVVAERDGKLFIIWNYIEELFEPSVIDRMFDMYISKIYDLIDTGSFYYHSVCKKEFEIYEKFNKTEDENFLQEKSIHELIVERSISSPDSIALELEGEEITYKELHQRSNQVANYLVAKNIKLGEPVGIIGYRCIETIYNILGVLKAGAIYVPIDPDNPEERKRQIKASSNISITVDQNVFVNEIKGSCSINFLPLIISSDSIAYIIHTSGSTGVPKGVVISHKAALNTILDINNKLNVGPKDTFFNVSSFGFDLSIYDIFGSLISGGRLVILPSNKDIGLITNLLISRKVTIWNTVPTFWSLVMENLPKGQSLPFLRYVLLSGDWIPLNLVQQTKERYPNLPILSLGGATECSVWSIFYPIQELINSWRSIPYGYPLANQKFYVLNYNLEICPIGVKGALYIGGVGITEGYLNDPQKTSSSIINHPQFGKLYFTGDYGKMLKEGYIEFLGRIDSQIKIRGHRIELGEIEKNINKIKGVANSLVAVHEKDNEKLLVGYIIPEDSSNSTDEKRTLKENAEKIEFKLGQKGLRKIEKASLKVSLEKFPDSSLAVDYNVFLNNLNIINPPSFKVLGYILSCFRKYTDSANELSKYYYPSAGSLYPIQIYLQIPENSLYHIPSGFYYYDPIEHQLILIKRVLSKEKRQSLYLIAKMEAIEPLYGPASKTFCLLESGHMSSLLRTHAYSHGVGFEEQNVDKESLFTHLDLNNDYILLESFTYGNLEALPEKKDSKIIKKINYLERQSYRSFTNELIYLSDLRNLLIESIFSIFKNLRISIYLYLKKDRVTSSESGYYKFDFKIKEIIKLSEDIELEAFYSENNLFISSQSSFSLFFVAKREEGKSNNSEYADLHESDEELFLEAGRIGQTINTFFVKKNIGVCAMGHSKTELLKNVLNLAESEKVIYSFVGGRIHNLQKEKWPRGTSFSEVHFMESVKDILGRNLPDYMVPTHLLLIDEIPLTINGKVDRKSLPIPEIKTDKKYVAPTNEIEKRLCQMYESFLNISEVGIDEDFFTIGGDSLKAITILQKIQKEFNITIPFTDFLNNSSPKLSGIIIKKSINDKNTTSSRREHFFFGGQHNKLFGICDFPEKKQSKNIGILVCQSIGQEMIVANQALINLNTRLSQEGYYSFRFDYYGCGESDGEFREITVDKLLNSIKLALQQLKERFPIDKLFIVGLRIGGTLAHLYNLKENEADGLILWNPVIKGEKYLNQLKTQHETWLNGSFAQKNKAQKEIEFLGFGYSELFLEEVYKLDLLERYPSEKEVLILEKDQIELFQNLSQMKNIHKTKILESKSHDFWIKQNEENAKRIIPTNDIVSIINWLNNFRDE